MTFQTTDFDIWAREAGPCNSSELQAIQLIAEGISLAGPYKATQKNNCLYISSLEGITLQLFGPGPTEGFKQFLWHYSSGKKPFRVRSTCTLEKFFAN